MYVRDSDGEIKIKSLKKKKKKKKKSYARAVNAGIPTVFLEKNP